MKNLKEMELELICRESQKIGMKCVGEIDGEKVYTVEYETVEYYTDSSRSVIYTVYNHNLEDYEIEYLDLAGYKVLSYLMNLKEGY